MTLVWVGIAFFAGALLGAAAMFLWLSAMPIPPQD